MVIRASLTTPSVQSDVLGQRDGHPLKPLCSELMLVPGSHLGVTLLNRAQVDTPYQQWKVGILEQLRAVDMSLLQDAPRALHSAHGVPMCVF